MIRWGQRSAPTAGAVLALTTGLHVVTALQVFTIPAIGPAMARAIGVSESLVGLQVVLVYFAAMITSLFAGSLVVRLGAVRVTQLSMTGCAAGLACCTIPSLTVMVLSSLLLGSAYGLVNPSTGQMLGSAIAPARRAAAFSFKQASVPFGGILAGLIAPMVAVRIGWQGALLMVAGCAVGGTLLLQRYRRWFPHEPSAIGTARLGALRDVRTVWQSRALRHTCLAVTLFAGIQLILTTYLVTLLVEHVGIGLVAAGFALSLFNGAGICARFGWGAAADRVKSGSLILAVVFFISVVLLLIFPLLTPAWPRPALYAFIMLLGIGLAGWTGVFVSEVLRLAPSGDAARAIAGSYVFTFAGALIGLGCFLLASRWMNGYGATLWMLAAMAGAGLMLSLRALAIVRDADFPRARKPT